MLPAVPLPTIFSGMYFPVSASAGTVAVRTAVVCPGPIAQTEMFHDVIPADSPKIDQIAASVPVRRLGTPDDVAQQVAAQLEADYPPSRIRAMLAAIEP